LLLNLLLAAPAANAVVQLVTLDAPTALTNDAEGKAEDAMVRCVFTRMAEPIILHSESWMAGTRLLVKGEIDALFPMPVDGSWQQVAASSAPLLLQRWVWYGDPKGTRVGIIKGSPQASYLAAIGQTVAIQTDSLLQLSRLLEAGRIDRSLVDEDELAQLQAVGRLGAKRGANLFERYVPLGVLFSHRFLADRPSFVIRFDQHVADCASDSFELNSSEQLAIASDVEPLLSELADNPDLQRLLTARLAMDPGTAALLAEDSAWRQLLLDGDATVLLPMVEGDVADLLQQLTHARPDWLAELFVTDNLGRAVGALSPPSDLWQGDEAKFTQTILQQTPFVESLSYDASSRKFLVHASLAVRTGQGKLLGVVTMGVDMASLLRPELPLASVRPPHR